MPYDITTKDGITIRNIPDNVPQDDPSLKAKVEAARSGKAAPAKNVPSAADNFDPTEGMSGFEKFAAGNTQQLTDAVLGGKQLLNKVTGGLFGDKDKLAAEAAEKAAIDKRLLATGAGGAGALVGRMAATAPAMVAGGAGAGAKLLPSVLKSIGIGAAEGTVKPGEDFSPVTNAAIGGGAGALGDLGSRGLTRLISPAMGATSDVIRGQVNRLRNTGSQFIGALGEDMPLLAKNITDSPMVKGLTDTLQKIPGLGHGVNANDAAQKRLMTRIVTTEAGTPMEEVGAGAARDVMTLPNNMATSIRNQTTPIPIPNVSADTQAALDAARMATGLSGKTPGPMLPNIRNAAQAQVQQPANQTAAQIAAGVPRPVVSPQMPTMLPNEFMTARAALSDAGFGATGTKRIEATAGQDALENAYRQHAGPGGAAHFDEWKRIHGLSRDVAKAADLAPVGAAPLSPQNMAAVLSKEEQRNPSNPLNTFITDMAARTKSTSPSDWRQMAGNLLLGTSVPVAGGIAGGLSGDSPGAVTGAIAAPLLATALLSSQGGARYLSNQALSPQMKAMIQQLLTTGAISTSR